MCVLESHRTPIIDSNLPIMRVRSQAPIPQISKYFWNSGKNVFNFAESERIVPPFVGHYLTINKCHHYFYYNIPAC